MNPSTPLAALALAALLVGTSGRPAALAKEPSKPPGKPEWQQELNPVAGERWLAMPEGKALYHFGWSGFKAAEAELTFSRTGKKIARMEVRGKTVGAARSIFRLDVIALFLSDIAASRPIRMRMLENYSNRSVILAQEYGQRTVTYSKARRDRKKIPKDLLEHRELDREGMKALTGSKGKRFRLPGMVDLQSSLFYLRAQPLRPGDKLQWVVFHGTSPYRIVLEAGEPRQLTVSAGTFRAIPLTVRLEWIDRKMNLRHHGNFRSATGWISDDPARLLLKVESDVFIGKVWAELISFEPRK